jgi:hypothetical protein
MLALAGLQACNAPWAGPSLPAGTHWVNFTLETSDGPTARGHGILAATSLSTLRSDVLAVARLGNDECRPLPNQSTYDPCWFQVLERPGVLYLAVATDSECTRPTNDNIALGTDVLYFVHWIGDSQGVCNMAMAAPHYRLYAVPQPPGSGLLSVQLLAEESSGTTVLAETTVSLG